MVILAYMEIAIVTLVLSGHAIEVMTSQNLGYKVDVGSFPINGLALYFIVGVVIDKATKRMPKWVGWALMIAAIGVLMMIFRFLGGYGTIIG